MVPVKLEFFRKEIFEEEQMFNKETSILEFSVHVQVLSKQDADTPIRKLKVFAILTDPNALTLKPLQEEHVTATEGKTILNMGECNTTEIVFTEIELINHSLITQEYGFLNLPGVFQ